MKYGINGETIHFIPLCKDSINRNDIIENKASRIELYCTGKDQFIIITNDPTNVFLTDEDLKLLAKSILTYSETGHIDDDFNDFLNILEPHYGEETALAAFNILTIEIIKRYSK